MDSLGARFDTELLALFQDYRADLRHQFRRNCFGYSVALVLLIAVSFASAWVLIGIAVWTFMLVGEAGVAYGHSETPDSMGFRRWQSRRDWERAGRGDKSSLKRLQNVQ